MDKELYLLVISLSMLHHEVVTHKANFCNITESYFVEVTKTETVQEFKKPSSFNLLGMFSNSNKYENVTKTVIGVEKRERVIEECCSGYKQKGDECVPINEGKSVPKPSTSSTTSSTIVAPNVSVTELMTESVSNSSKAEVPSATESKMSKPIIESLPSTVPNPSESTSGESFSTESEMLKSSPFDPPPEASFSELPPIEPKPKDIVSMEPSSTEHSSPLPSPTESKPNNVTSTESPSPEPSPTEPKTIDISPTQSSSSESLATEAKTADPTTPASPALPAQPETLGLIASETPPVLAPTEPKAPELVSSEVSYQPTSTEPKAPEAVSSEVSYQPASTESKAPEAVSSEVSYQPASTESKAPEPVSSEVLSAPPPTEPKTPEQISSEASLVSTTESKAPVLESASSEISPKPIPNDQKIPESTSSTTPTELAPTEPKVIDSIPSETLSKPTSINSNASASASTESSPQSSSTSPTKSEAESVTTSTAPQTSSSVVSDSTSTSVQPADLLDELIVNPIDPDQTTIINGRKKRSIVDVPLNSIDLDSNTESDINLDDSQFNLNNELYSRKENHEIVVSDIEDENDDNTWIEILELLSFGAVVVLLVITVQASYDGETFSSLWRSKNKNQNIDSYGEFWIYDSQSSLEEV